MSDIRRALVRKFGPLPAWAWAGILAGALFFMRRSPLTMRSAAAPPVTDATSPGVTDGTAPAGSDDNSGQDDQRGDPVTLQPGESVYDPRTGKVLTGQSEQQDPEERPGRPLPVVLEPGETVYDPQTGQTSPKERKTKAKKKPTKRTPKKKSQHEKRTAVRKPGHGKSKPRGTGRIKNPLHSMKPASTRKGRHEKPTGQPSRGRTPAASAPHGTQQRSHTPVQRAAPVRTRPAAPQVVSHAQRVSPHPARAASAPPPQHHAAPAPRPPAPKRRRK